MENHNSPVATFYSNMYLVVYYWAFMYFLFVPQNYGWCSIEWHNSILCETVALPLCSAFLINDIIQRMFTQRMLGNAFVPKLTRYYFKVF